MPDTTPDDYDPTEGLPSNDELRPIITGRTMADWSSHNATHAARINLDGGIPWSALSPENREQLRERVKDIPHDDTAGQMDAFGQFMAEKALPIRLATGPGPDATAYDQEVYQLELDKQESRDRLDQIQAELTRVNGHDPATGAPILAHAPGSMRWHGLIDEMEGHVRRFKLLEGSEGEQRLQRAAAKAFTEHRNRLRQQRDADEIKRRAGEIVRTERIEQAAEARAKFMRPSL